MLELAPSSMRMCYSDDVIQLMRKFYHSLSEKDRRRYAAIEARKLGHGGISYISRVLGCSRDTIKVGIYQLENLSKADLGAVGVRKQGAGRKRILETMIGLEETFNWLIAVHNPQGSQQILLSQRKIAELLEEEGFRVSVTVIKQLIQKYEAHM